MRKNPILMADSYKYSHYLQYPPGTQYVRSHIMPRWSERYSEVVHFGLQAFIKEYLQTPITRTDIVEAQNLITKHGEPFNLEGFERILTKHKGYFPVEIEAPPEGTVIPIRNLQVQVVNTDPELPWVTSFVETALLRAIWYPSTVATVSREVKKLIYNYLDMTSDDPDGQIAFKLHDFGYRGATSEESARLGGLGHLVNFMGTDTVGALQGALEWYNTMDAGFSIPAAEHSTITAWGPGHEIEAYRNMVEQFGGPNKLYAVVSDSYDIDNAVSNIWGRQLKTLLEIKGGTLVVRPDSGEPISMVENVIERLGVAFGTTRNKKGYKVLPPSVRMIQGDGINPYTISSILHNLAKKGWSAENIAFGMGGGLLQDVDRDTLGYAMKANEIFRPEIGETDPSKWFPVSKKSSSVGKESIGGLLDLRNDDGHIFTTNKKTVLGESMLETVYEDGKLLIETNLAEIRERAAI